MQFGNCWTALNLDVTTTASHRRFLQSWGERREVSSVRQDVRRTRRGNGSRAAEKGLIADPGSSFVCEEDTTDGPGEEPPLQLVDLELV